MSLKERHSSQHVEAKPSALKHAKWTEYALRFVFGGLITAIAGWLASSFGPAFGGLFLAFPAILPASVTLVEKHAGRQSAAWDVRGSVAGAIGLIAFGAVVWALASAAAPWLVLIAALVAWLILSLAAWWVLFARSR